MTLLPPRFSRSRKSRARALDYEIVQEQAAALGRLGGALETAVAALSNYDRAQAEPGDDAARARSGALARAGLVQDASDAQWCFIIRRHHPARGLRDWRLIVREYGVPAEVQSRAPL